jgi:hypothetical protein
LKDVEWIEDLLHEQSGDAFYRNLNAALAKLDELNAVVFIHRDPLAVCLVDLLIGQLSIKGNRVEEIMLLVIVISNEAIDEGL